MSNPFTNPQHDADGAPSWLSEAPAAPPPSLPKATSAYPVGSSTSATNATLAPLDEPEPRLKKLMLIVRVVNICMTVLLCALAVLTLELTSDASVVVVALYVFVFGVMIFCFELALNVVAKKVSENCGFMYSAKGRAIFFFFVGVLCFEMKPTIFAYVDGICMILLALFNFYLLFRYPSFEEYQRRKHYYGSYTGGDAQAPKGPTRV